MKNHLLCEMLEKNMHLHMTYFAGKTPQIERLPVDDATVVRSAISDDMFNYVLSARFNEQNVAARIEHVIRLFEEQGLPFSWWVGESDTPSSLKEELSSHGLNFKEQNVGMILELKHFHRQAASRLNFKHVLQHQAKQKGFSLAGLEASSEGKSLYKRLGFREICIFEEYGWIKK